MRKFIIALVSVGVVALIFLGYALLMDTASFKVPQSVETTDLALPNSQEDSQKSPNILHHLEETNYYKYDKDTREIQAVYGFKKLLNPGTESSRWQVEKPYLTLYRSNYQCRIDADTGAFQMERSGSNLSPKDAQLDGHIVFHITPGPAGKISDTIIEMDTLTFSSERSEFSTDGPVSIKSEQMQLNGFGMLLFFDTAGGRIDYLHIRDLDELRIFKTARSDSQKGPGSEQPQSTQSAASHAADTSTEDEQRKTESPSKYYQCILEDNVQIKYGNDLIVAGADQINIHNILLSKVDENTNKKPEPLSVQGSEDQRSSAPIQPDQNVENESRSVQGLDSEVVVTCDGGIILKPMQETISQNISAMQQQLTVEMNGNPLHIERISSYQASHREPLVSCGTLIYAPEEDILKLFTHSYQPEIVLYVQRSLSRIHTRGNVWWNRKNQRANIEGPGKVYLSNSGSPSEPSEVSFQGIMDVLFEKTAMPDLIAPVTIKTINIAGGMDAVFKQNGEYKTIADSATFEFGTDNTLSQARLLGGVQFKSLMKDKPHSASADSATFEFGPGNTLKSTHMLGDVCLESLQDQQPFRASARKADFYFHLNTLKTANLAGSVTFFSNEGTLTSSDANILFGSDETRTLYPEMMYFQGDATLETLKNPPDSPPARFEARQIDYDLQTGSGVAHGPVHFRFYQQSDTSEAKNQPWIPVTVTADENARFLADETHTIKQVVFNGNVLTSRKFETADFVQLDDLHGEKLIIDLEKGHTDSIEISHIRMAGGDVYAQSQRLREGQTSSNVKLFCTEINFDDKENLIIATGPGEIQMDNSQGSGMQHVDSTAGVNLRRPCYVFIEGFDKIQWDLTKQEIVAEGQQENLKLAYVPLENGLPAKYIYVNSMHFDLRYDSDLNGQTFLKRVFTDRIITYTEKDRNNDKILHTITGQRLIYDTVDGNGWVKIEGTPAMPVNVDGYRTPFVFIHPVTGKVETSLSTIPGVLRNR